MLFRKTFTTEQEIIKGCLKNERKAQEQLYKTYSKKFLAICIRYVKDKNLAEDVMIEGFMKIFDKLSQFEGKGSFEGWMKRIIVTQALLTLRKQKNLNMEVLQAESHLEPSQTTYEFDHLEADDLMLLIKELPVGYRTVFNLYAIEGYSHAEIGDLLGITESTSKSQLNRARNVLKQQIADIQTKERRING
ncbi:RNA polymerase sigma factor [Cecembia lonarensis]|uniref:RNA polymerase sigma factor sigX n=1 Tax=Cecembia lonarensis (strain CCUG 58316 / KCTC 22772 / LW9) TaxID=1225176 RepID=K1LHW6_CECL9|nr:sigma-70 family RNA polymerase sigma factor [Cecembia lonarensis]EKB49848.1 RNA polymerase sigma factor sigX [Cecembia lonarensis LW9]